jgi:hypothetical protein
MRKEITYHVPMPIKLRSKKTFYVSKIINDIYFGEIDDIKVAIKYNDIKNE